MKAALLILYFELATAFHSRKIISFPHTSSLATTERIKSLFILKASPITDFSVFMYDAQLWFSHSVETQFSEVTPFSLSILFFAGLITSFNPCTVGLIPLTLAYLGGNSDEDKESKLMQATLYAIGLAITLSAFGLSAAFLGQLYGTAANNSSSSVVTELPSLFSSALVLVMGLNLLNIINFQLPSFKVGDFGGLPAPMRALLLGSSSALIASPCSSPVLASLLAVIAASHNPTLGASLLFTYSLGYATPVVVAGAMSSRVSGWTVSMGAPWITTVLAALLVTYGTYSSLDTASRIMNL